MVSLVWPCKRTRLNIEICPVFFQRFGCGQVQKSLTKTVGIILLTMYYLAQTY